MYFPFENIKYHSPVSFIVINVILLFKGLTGIWGATVLGAIQMQKAMISALKSQGPTIYMCLSQDYSIFTNAGRVILLSSWMCSRVLRLLAGRLGEEQESLR